MMASSLFSVMSLLAIVFAKPIEQRAQGFDVSMFDAGCIPHGSTCSFHFTVTTDQLLAPTNCSASIYTAFFLPDVPSTACYDSSILWSFATDNSDGNYTLFLQDYKLGLAAFKVWNKTDFPIIEAGATVYQQYTGPASFVVP